MAAESGRPPAAVIEALRRTPAAFAFFQAVRLLEWAARRGRRDPQLMPSVQAATDVGGDAAPGAEAVRFRTHQGLSFPASEITRMHEPPSGPPELDIAFLGLTGPSGALPQHYTELVVRNLRGKNPAMRDFFDMFNHRAAALFYRAWAKYRLPIAYEAGEGRGDDPVTAVLYALIGLGTPQLRGRLAVEDQTLVHYAGILGHSPRSATALAAMLSDHFGRPIRIDQFQGHWLRLGADEVSLLPGPGAPEGRFCRLGVDLVVGERVWDVQSSFRIRIGPLDYAEFRRFMPDGDDLRRLADLTRLFVGPALTFDVQVTLAKEAVPACRLVDDPDSGPRLGWNTWLKDRPFLDDATDSVFRPNGTTVDSAPIREAA